ncbi:MAG: 3-deoxy-7-phosphoheptulonate synthase [Aminivibrio sp.]|uniref:3-deoxy-7-phosphoheptulonate synthase n=1 Tax=Aminivibrio sp. TaxID=1872489 RepID=UPI002B214531|nr:3-deoxy-7-phosphoheptulonate synthase [Aminivibrio sp.]MEA4953852.1 3-deoxy-7-phosphoheptulonate synthase [Aminivibrio sp.]
MIVVEMAQNSTGIDLERVRESVERGGKSCRVVSGREASYIVASDETDTSGVSALPGVRKVNAVSCCYPLASRVVHPVSRPVEIAPGVVLGEGDPVVMAGPCAVESRDQLLETALAVRKAGARVLRGGAFKPRSHPYAFQGLGSEGIALLKEARKASGLPVITEVMSPEEAEWVAPHVDILQVGARNMQNFSLLKVLGRLDRPVLLKRGMAATVEEWLQAAEYILAGGNDRVILCERGIRSFDQNTRNTLDLGVIPLLKSLTHLPVVADPSHATGRRDLVLPMSLAAIAAGADGLLVEVHCAPETALCDGPQSLDPEEFSRLMRAAKRIMEAVREEGTPWERMLAR